MITTKSLRCSLAQQFDLTNQHLVCFPNDPQASLNNLLVDIQQPKLEANQWQRPFKLDPCLLLEVTPQLD